MFPNRIIPVESLNESKFSRHLPEIRKNMITDSKVKEESARVSSYYIVAGIGFIGAGAIWAEKDKIRGITTASSLWVTAAIGLSVGVGDYPLAIIVTGLVFLILSSKEILKKIRLEK